MNRFILNDLRPETRRRVEFLLNNCIGKTLEECAALLEATEDHIDELSIPLTQRKGSAGRFLEQLVTGETGDNKSTADDGVVDIKSMNIIKPKRKGKYSFSEGSHLSGFAPKENLRITIINYNDIQRIPYQDSGLCRKNKILIIFYDKGPKGTNLKDSIFLGFGVIDLSTDENQLQLEEDYNTFRQVCSSGEAHTIGSIMKTGWYLDKETKQKKCQYGTLVKSYSSDTRKQTHIYTDAKGNECGAYGRALYIFKQELISCLEVMA